MSRWSSTGPHRLPRDEVGSSIHVKRRWPYPVRDDTEAMEWLATLLAVVIVTTLLWVFA